MLSQYTSCYTNTTLHIGVVCHTHVDTEDVWTMERLFSHILSETGFGCGLLFQLSGMFGPLTLCTVSQS